MLSYPSLYLSLFCSEKILFCLHVPMVTYKFNLWKVANGKLFPLTMSNTKVTQNSRGRIQTYTYIYILAWKIDLVKQDEIESTYSTNGAGQKCIKISVEKSERKEPIHKTWDIS